MTKKQPTLLDRVKAAAASRPKHIKNWCDRLPPEAREQALAIRKAWQNGEIPSSANGLARDIVSEFRRAGIETCGVQGMRVWLSRD